MPILEAARVVVVVVVVTEVGQVRLGRETRLQGTISR